MRIHILGAGALGSLVGGLLAQQHNVTLIGREEHMLAVREKGLSITGLTELRAGPKAVTGPDRLEAPDLVIVSVKSYNTAMVAGELARLPPGVQIMSLQNGLGNIEALAEHLPEESIIAGLTSHGATLLGPGEIRHGGEGDTVIGRPFAPNDDFVGELASILSLAGMKTRISDNMEGEIWAKVIVNAAINPLTAVFNIRNGHLLESRRLRTTMLDIVEEGREVAESRGVKLPPGDLLERALDVARRTADNRSSMLQDIDRCRQTEIDSINGALTRMGEEAGIRMTANRTMALLVKDLEARCRDSRNF